MFKQQRGIPSLSGNLFRTIISSTISVMPSFRLHHFGSCISLQGSSPLAANADSRLYVCMLDLAQVFSLIIKTIRKKFSPTPRELIEWTAPLTFDFASYYNYALFYVTIALSYATIAPLVSPFALLYFTISYAVHKYDMMYVYFTRNESGGSMWRVFSHCWSKLTSRFSSIVSFSLQHSQT